MCYITLYMHCNCNIITDVFNNNSVLRVVYLPTQRIQLCLCYGWCEVIRCGVVLQSNRFLTLAFDSCGSHFNAKETDVAIIYCSNCDIITNNIYCPHLAVTLLVNTLPLHRPIMSLTWPSQEKVVGNFGLFPPEFGLGSGSGSSRECIVYFLLRVA